MNLIPSSLASTFRELRSCPTIFDFKKEQNSYWGVWHKMMGKNTDTEQASTGCVSTSDVSKVLSSDKKICSQLKRKLLSRVIQCWFWCWWMHFSEHMIYWAFCWKFCQNIPLLFMFLCFFSNLLLFFIYRNYYGQTTKENYCFNQEEKRYPLGMLVDTQLNTGQLVSRRSRRSMTSWPVSEIM